MTKLDPKREPGYRGSLPTRHDRLARPWMFIITGIFVLIMVLSVLAIPSRFIPDPTPVPLPSAPASSSVEPSASASGSGSASPSATPSASGSAEPSPSAE
jgi:hypothetical protein